MRNLLRANFRRLWRSKIFWIAVILQVLGAGVLSANLRLEVVQFGAHVTLDEGLFEGTTILGFFLAVVCSLFLGVEYGDGTLRNKLVVGCTRRDIYLVNFIVTAVSSAIVYLVLIVTSAVLMLMMFEPSQIAFIKLLTMAVVGLFASVAHAAIFTLVGMLCPNRTYTAVLCLVLSMGLLAGGAYVDGRLLAREMTETITTDSSAEIMIVENGEPLYLELVPNPRYLTGFVRDVFEFLYDLNPTSQFFQLAYRNVARPVRVLLCDLGIIFLTTLGGVWCFSKKDVK